MISPRALIRKNEPEVPRPSAVAPISAEALNRRRAQEVAEKQLDRTIPKEESPKLESKRIEHHDLELLKARDALVVWETLADAVGLQCPGLLTDRQEIIEEAKGLKGWITANQSALAWIKDLDLSEENLTSIPEELCELSQLEFLNLANNKITSIPSKIGNLTQLYYLNLCENQITSLPIEFGNLLRLQTLYLTNNQITTLPDELGNLSQLLLLYLKNNQLISIPKTLGKLSKLVALDLSNNRLSSLPQELADLSQLRWHNLALQCCN